MLFVVVVVLCVVASTSAQIPSWGRCKQPPVVQNFNISQISGDWYEFERYYTFFERGLRCVKAKYIDESDKGCIKIEAVAYNGDTEICYEAIAYSPDSRNLAKMKYKPLHHLWPAAPFWLIDTDYKSHAVFYSCVDMYLFHWDIIWIKSRRPQGPPATTVTRIVNKLRRLGFNVDKLRKTDQTNCRYDHNCPNHS